MHKFRKHLEQIWMDLYGNNQQQILADFITEIEHEKEAIQQENTDEWYKDAVVYSMYVDLFNKNFEGLRQKLDYLQDLGVSCLWLLPILDSPMRDAGFDIRNYRQIRPDLLGLAQDTTDAERTRIFRLFLDEAHSRGIRVIFDIAINHTSNEHPWFIESRKGPENPYRDYYIWNKDTNLYKETRLLFEGMCPSNWEKDGDWYYFHRFFEFQPDLNYRNPAVLLDMSRNFVYWLKQGIDGFRADAIPYLWKEDGTSCENLPKTHTIVKFFRTVLDYLKPGTLLLAEACQPPTEVVKYIGSGDECNAGYHFPLMPQMFKALEMQSAQPVKNTLSTQVTPAIPATSQWFTFLRCHDELSLERVYVSEEDRKYIHEHYCHKPEWDFRLGQGISARMSELFDRNPDRILLAFALMLSLPGTPVLYYGDEFGKQNDENYYKEQIQLTGKDDTRFLVRGKIDWERLEKNLSDKNSLESKIYYPLKSLVNKRISLKVFGRGQMVWEQFDNNLGNKADGIISFYRQFKNKKVLVLINLTSDKQTIRIPKHLRGEKSLISPLKLSEETVLLPYSYHWIKCKANDKNQL